MSWYYYEVGDLRFCYSSTKAYGPCPFTDPSTGRGIAPGWLQAVLDESDDPDVRALDAETIFRQAHRSSRHSDDPSRCQNCGARREELGYATWIDEPWPSEEALRAEVVARIENEMSDEYEAVSSALSTRAMNLRLGNTRRRRPGSLRHHRLRREAKAWAVENQAVERAALAEAAG